MIKSTYSRLMSFPFSQSFQKLTNASFPAPVAYAIKKLDDEMHKVRAKATQEYRDFVHFYAEKDENGEIRHPDPENLNSFDVHPDKMEEYRKAEQKFGGTEFEIKRPKLHLDALGSVQLAATDLIALDPIIHDPEEATQGHSAPVVGSIGPKVPHPVVSDQEPSTAG